jgi:hypothetical protein
MLPAINSTSGRPQRRCGLPVLKQPHRCLAHQVGGALALGVVLQPLARTLHKCGSVNGPVALSLASTRCVQVMQRPQHTAGAEVQRRVSSLRVVARFDIQRMNRPAALRLNCASVSLAMAAIATTRAGLIHSYWSARLQRFVAVRVVERMGILGEGAVERSLPGVGSCSRPLALRG